MVFGQAAPMMAVPLAYLQAKEMRNGTLMENGL